MIGSIARALALVAALFGAGTAASAAELTRIPARFVGHDVLLEVSLAGGAPVWMKFDSAIPGSLLAASYAQRATLRFPLVDIRLGPVALPRVYFEPIAEDAAIAGRIGADALGDRVLMIDYRRHEVWLSEPVHPAPPPIALAAR